jgi:oligopeptide transport system permease protein
VLANLLAAFPVSLEMGLYALVFALVFGVSLGLVAGLYRNTWIDHVSMTAALVAVSASSLVLGSVLLMVFCVWLRWLPWGGWEAFSFAGPDLLAKILPTLTLGLVYAAWFARLTRAGMLEVIGQDWIRTARAKGLSEWQVVTRHALRGAILPAVSFLGPALAGIVTGSVVVERIFAVPGVGEYFVTAAINRDYPMVMGTVVLYSSLLILANLAVDVTYAALDPRVRAHM